MKLRTCRSDPHRRGRCFVVSSVSCIPFLFNLHLHVIGASNIASDETSGLLPPLVKVSSSLACAGLFACTGMLSAWKGFGSSCLNMKKALRDWEGWELLDLRIVRGRPVDVLPPGTIARAGLATMAYFFKTSNARST
nr:hypothetical protein [Tanacetum cinerariifolium]